LKIDTVDDLQDTASASKQSEPGVRGAGVAADLFAAMDGRPRRLGNPRRRAALVVITDALAAGLSVTGLLLVRFGLPAASGSNQQILAIALVPAWLIALVLAGGYDTRFLATGTEQYRRVVRGAAWLLAMVSFIAFATHSDVSRSVVLTSVPVIAFLTIIERHAWLRQLQRRFARGWAKHLVVAIGTPGELGDLVDHMHRTSASGLRIVAAITPGEVSCPLLPGGVAWAGGTLKSVAAIVESFGADTLAIAGSQVLPRGDLRRLSWELEDTDIDLVVAPAMTDIAGPRIRIRPVEGLPLLHIERPQFSGPQLVVKSLIDRTTAGLLIVMLSPVLVVCAATVRLTSAGPITYRQVRVGLRGEHFTILKFRSMRIGADTTRAEIADVNEREGALFKIRRDPRTTAFGRFMRRWSLDELPQLFNVINGSMSLVGPRPLPVADVEQIDDDARRRTLVKPGMTGLWQVSGRSDLTWEELLRLDLHYVDHWSVGLDLILLWRTLAAVVRGRGAY
jgi:exopolysaccharide biosynthesis polyprenyl glycosylphosphotransferase